MRLFELLLIVCLGALIALCVRLPEATKARWFLFAAVILVGAAQIGLEGFRWQMFFSYIVVSSLLVALVLKKMSARHLSANALKKFWQWQCCFLLLSTALAILVPIPNLPSPTGPYPVGTQSYYLTDPTRLETFAGKGKSRELMIQVWYPSIQTVGSKIAPYMPSYSDMTPYLAAPIFAVAASHLPLIPTHATIGTPIRPQAQPYPVLIFSHGMMGGRIQNTVLAEDLASHGYVVVAMDHTYDCSFAILPEQTICSLLLTKNPPPLSLIANEGLEVRAKDVRFVLDQLAKLNDADPQQILTHRLDLDKVGIFGHSLGGQTSLIACSADKRFKAGLSLDGVTTEFATVSQPFMLMQADRQGDAMGVEDLCKHLSGPHYVITIKNSGHANFTDLPLLTPVHWVACLSGTIDGLRAVNIVDTYALAFFDHFLKGKQEPLLQEKSHFPEVEHQFWKPDQANLNRRP